MNLQGMGITDGISRAARPEAGKHILISNGFEAVPKREYNELDMDEILGQLPSEEEKEDLASTNSVIELPSMWK